jgi:hypothetical protein
VYAGRLLSRQSLLFTWLDCYYCLLGLGCMVMRLPAADGAFTLLAH